MVDRNPDRPFRLDAAFVKAVTEPAATPKAPALRSEPACPAHDVGRRD